MGIEGEETWRREAFARQEAESARMEAALAAARAAEGVDQAKRAEAARRAATAAGAKQSKRRTIIFCQEEILGLQEAAQLAASMDRAGARMRKAAARERHIFLTGWGAFLDLPEVHHLLGNREGVLRLWGEARKEGITYSGFSHECALAQELERLCDSGRFGTDLMGRLEVFRIERLEDWSGDTLTLLGFRQMANIAGERHDVRFWFEQCRQHSLTAAPGMLGATKVWNAAYSDWLAIEAEPAKGFVSKLEDAVPLEVGWRHAGGWGGKVLYIRGLKGTGPEPKVGSQGDGRLDGQ